VAAERLEVARLPQVLAVMVHPPAPPKGVEPWDWHFRVQVAAALIASHMGKEAWAESPRRKALEAVLDGPADWTNTAAVIALLDVARRDEAARPSAIAALLRTTRRSLNPPVYQNAIRPAAFALLELPGLAADVVRELRELVSEE
jgi:hypothetical protein